MAKNIIKHSGVVVVGTFASDPSGMPDGSMYYNSTTNKVRIQQNGSFSDANSVTPSFNDSTFRIQDNGDATKQIAFEASGITTGTTRTVTMPDANVNLGLVATAIQSSEKGAANGVAELDANSLIPITQIPPAALERLVIVADQTARFALTTATVQNGDTVKQTDTGVLYFVSDDANLGNSGGYTVYTAGTASSVAWSGVTGTPTTLAGYGITDYAAAAKAAAVADAINDGTTDVAPSQNAVFDALTGKSNTGHTHVAADVTDFTSAARTAAVADSITDGVTNIAPSQNAVFDALALKLANVVEDTTPQLGGDLDLNAKVVMGTMDRSAVGSPTNFVEEQYIHATTLAGSSSGVTASAFNFAHATFQGCELTYSIKEATTNRVRIGTLRVATDGTNIGISDSFSETADCDVSWDAAINGANVELKYTTATANAKVMRTDVKRFKV